MERFFFSIIFILAGLVNYAQCSFSLGPDQTFCQDQTISTSLSAPAGQSSYNWSTGATSQSITATAAGAYSCTVTMLSNNLVSNSDFSSGNTGFSSSYSVGSGGSWGPVSYEGTYYITDNANYAHSNFPWFYGHGGSGNMMVVNGSGTAGTSVWCQSFAVTPNTTYNFSTWVATCVASNSSELASLQFSINGSLLGNAFSPSLSAGSWTQFSSTWNSGANTTADICIVNQNTALSGNDFAIDDIFFQQVCTASSSMNITVSPGPTVTVPGNTVVCNNETVPASTFSSNPAGATYTWTNNNTAIGLAASGSGDLVPFNATNPGTGVQNAIISVTPTLNGCTGNAQSYTITVNPDPVLSSVPNQTVCVNNPTDAITFSSTPSGATVNWTNTDNSIGLASSGNGDIASFTGLNSGSSPVTATINAIPTLNGCTGSSTSFNIIVSPGPTLNSVTSQTVCAGANTSTISFVTNPPGVATVNWTNSDASIGLATNGSGDIIGFTADNSTNNTIVANLTAVPSIGTCVGNSQSFDITVLPSPTVNAVSNTTVCNNDIVNSSGFNGTNGATFNWTNSNTSIGLGASGAGDYSSFTAINSGNSSQSAIITVTPTLNGCNGTAAIYTITVNPTPGAPGTNTVAPYCLNDNAQSLVATASPGGTLLWWGTESSGGIPSSVATIPSTSSAGSTTYYVSQSITGCEGPRAGIDVLVINLPVVSTVNDTQVCSGATVPAYTFSGSPAGTTINWTNNNTGIGLTGSGIQNTSSFTAVNNGTTSVSSIITLTPVYGNCTGSTISFSITIDPKPIATVTNVSACNGSSVPGINWTSTPAGASYTWAAGNTSIGISASGTGSVNLFTGINNGTTDAVSTVSVTPTLNGCTGDESTFSITIKPTPSAPIVPATPVYCKNATASPLSPSGVDYLWYTAATGGTGNITAPTPSTNLAGSQTYFVSQTIDGCEGPRSAESVIINELPTAALALVSTACPPLCTNLNLSSTDNLTMYNWDLGDGSTSSGNDTVFDHCYMESGLYNVAVTITDINGCTNTINFPGAVSVADVPKASFYYEPMPVTMLDPTVNFINTSSGSEPIEYQWSLGLADGTYYDSQNISYTYQEAGAYIVQLKATNMYGCVDSIYQTVIIEEETTLYIPNAFTPNNDGDNESFSAQGIGIDSAGFTMYIFDRWGEKIFQTSDINEGWTGKTKSGVIAANGIYAWKLIYRDFNGDNKIKSGHVTLIR